jgi:predicted dehydrogenase
MLKIGLLGVGHLGKIHLKCIQLAAAHFELVGFFDPDDRMATEVAATTGVRRFVDLDALIQACDVLDVVTPTYTHFELSKRIMEAGRHLFIEKPLTHTVAEAKELVALAVRKGIKVQVGHVERFNPALLALGERKLNPMFVEAHRLAVFNPRGTDVSVVLDLMIHDLDILLSLVPSKVRDISASGIAIVSRTPDIANARIEFDNGCVANLTASRISMKQMRKVRLFQQDAYISLDFLDKKAEIVRLHDSRDPADSSAEHWLELNTDAGQKWMQLEMPPIEPVNAIKMELEAFAESIIRNTTPKVSIEAGYEALVLAHQIIEKIEDRKQQYQSTV